MNLPTNFPYISLSETLRFCGSKPIADEITVIIPTLGRPILETCLAKIIIGNKWPGGLIVVNQGDYPVVADWINLIKSTGIKSVYLHNSQPGKPSSLNMALKRTETRFFAITDDDCFIEPDWVEKMVIQLKDHPDWIITGRVDPAGNETVAIAESRQPSVQYRPKLRFDSMAGGNMGASIDVIQKTGFFDENVTLRYAAEDVEFAYRALKNGIPIAYAPDVAVSHFGWRPEKVNHDRFKAYAYGQGGFYGKYLLKGDWVIAFRTAYTFFRALRRWLLNSIKGNKEHAALGRAYFTGLLPGIVDSIRIRMKE